MKTHRTTEVWKEIVLDFDNTGLSASKYCDQNNIKKSTFQYWVKKYSKKHTANLVKVKTTLPRISGKVILLEMNNFKLEIPSEVSDIKLARLISLIREYI